MIFLIGFMGSGKTTVGKALASLLERPFIDLDEYISKKSGRSIAEIFTCAGESAFRVIERDALLEVAGSAKTAVVATGGGLPVNPANRAIMKSCGHIVHLKAQFDTLLTRIPEDPGRPLWNERASRLLEERRPAYEDADFIVETDAVTVQEAVQEVFRHVENLTDPTPVLVQGSPYPIYIGRGIFRDLGRLLARHARPEGVFVLVDQQVDKHHHRRIRSALRGLKHHSMVLPAGETSKSFPYLQQVLDEMISAQANRQWICMAIGGGVVGDLAAFAASIFMRGIPVVQVPTTLLAQVDSGIGGKTGINLDQGKNLAGTFFQPLFVLSDVEFLSTLDPAQIRDAMAEVIKYGVIMDRKLFEYLENKETIDYERVVAMCSTDKAWVVTRDEREGGLRRILNFGHTLGHAIELARNYEVSHGQAVGVGILFASWLSHEQGLLKPGDMNRIQPLVKRFVFKGAHFVLPEPDEIGGAIAMDKKGAAGGVHFVLTPGIGDATVKKLTSSQILGAYGRFIHGYEKGI
jgi:shikimate kinase/3-dehydroquinate synthase